MGSVAGHTHVRPVQQRMLHDGRHIGMADIRDDRQVGRVMIDGRLVRSQPRRGESGPDGTGYRACAVDSDAPAITQSHRVVGLVQLAVGRQGGAEPTVSIVSCVGRSPAHGRGDPRCIFQGTRSNECTHEPGRLTGGNRQ